MITTMLVGIGIVVLALLNQILLVFALPYISNMTDGIAWGISMVYMLNTQFPVVTLFECLLVLVLCHYFKFQIRIFFHMIFPMIPFIGKRLELPQISGYDDMSQPYYQSIRGDPGNKNGMGTYYLYKRRKK